MAATNCTITEVTGANVDALWPGMQKDLRDCTFIAVDTEMSGLGKKGATFQSNVEDRYRAIKEAAQTRSLISLGLACFKLVKHHCKVEVEESKSKTASSPQDNGCEENADRSCAFYAVKVYNIILLCEDSFCVDSEAVEFLVQHGFDFNKQFSQGIRYKRGCVQRNDPSFGRRIFSEMIRNRKPLVFHNGFADLVFLYECLYTSCPKKLPTFLADLCEMFPSGIYDVKRIASKHSNLRSSFLLYVYKRHELLNAGLWNSKRISVSLIFTDEDNNTTVCHGGQYSHMTPTNERNGVKVCDKFAKYGWCLNGQPCKHSHNIDDIIMMHDYEDKPKKRNRKRSRKQQNGTADMNDSVEVESMDVQPLQLDGDTVTTFVAKDNPCDGQGPRDADASESPVTEQKLSGSTKKRKRKRAKEKKKEEDSNKTQLPGIELMDTEQLSASEILTGYDKQDDEAIGGKENGQGSCRTNGAMVVDKMKPVMTNCHKAGIDAFMAGFSFAVFTVSQCKEEDSDPHLPDPGTFSSAIPFLSDELKADIMNKLYLSGKNIPLWICRSCYAKTSPNHDAKLLEIFL